MGKLVTQRFELCLPTATILKVLATALLVGAGLRLWPEVVFLSLSLLLSVALEPVVAWLERRRIPRGASVLLLALAMFAVIGAIVAFVLPPLGRQIADLIANFPAFRARIEHGIPPEDAVLKKIVTQVFLLPSSPTFASEVNQPLLWGRLAVSGVMTTFFVLVTALYLLLDGKRLYAWLLAYVPREHRGKMAETVPAVSQVVQAYVRGQLLTSLMFGVFVAILLSVLHVPAVVPLAILAGLCDVIPVVGIIVATAPAALLALTVSPSAALLTVGLYALYHLFETYFIVPRVYGNTLRLSTLAVLLALIIGGTLQGILGAVIVLPLVAAYPIIERIWLKDYLADEVIADHRALASAAASGSDEAVEAVLQGEEHPDEQQAKASPGP